MTALSHVIFTLLFFGGLFPFVYILYHIYTISYSIYPLPTQVTAVLVIHFEGEPIKREDEDRMDDIGYDDIG